MSKKIIVISIFTLVSALFLNVFPIKSTSASTTNSKVYKQRTFNVIGKGSPEKIAKMQDRLSWSKYEPTGIYVSENEEIKINLENGNSTILYIQSYGAYNAAYQWDEQQFSLNQGVNTITNHKSGMLYLANLDSSGASKVNITGGRHIPVFEKNNSDADFKTMLAEHKNAPYVEYVSDHSLITVSYKRAQQFTKNPSKLLKYIDIALEEQDKFAGFSPNASKEENKLDPHYRHMIEDSKEDYYMYATSYRTAYAYKGEAVQFIVDADKFISDGWGPWHENGHTQQQQSWNFHEMTEVQVNLYSLVSQIKLGNKPRLETGDEYKRMNDYFKLRSGQKNYDQLTESNGGVDFFLKLTMLWQLHLGLGENFYPNLHIAYRELPETERPKSAEEKKNYFMYMASKVAGRNLLPFFDQWGLNPSEKTRSDIASLNLPMLEAKIWESTDAKPVREKVNIPSLSQKRPNPDNEDNNSSQTDEDNNSNQTDEDNNSNQTDEDNNSNQTDEDNNSNQTDEDNNSSQTDEDSNSNQTDKDNNSNQTNGNNNNGSISNLIGGNKNNNSNQTNENNNKNNGSNQTDENNNKDNNSNQTSSNNNENKDNSNDTTAKNDHSAAESTGGSVNTTSNTTDTSAVSSNKEDNSNVGQTNSSNNKTQTSKNTTNLATSTNKENATNTSNNNETEIDSPDNNGVTDTEEGESYFITVNSKNKGGSNTPSSNNDISPSSGEQSTSIYFIILSLLSVLAITIMQTAKKRTKRTR